MSNEDLLKQDPLVAPADSDEQFITRLEYEDPIRKASIWLHKLIIHRLRDVQLAAPWYRGETDEPPDRFVSDLFSQADGRFCRRFDYYRKELKALGIKDNDDFVSALGARSDRISRTRMKR